MARTAGARILAPSNVPLWTPIVCLLIGGAIFWVAVTPLGEPRLWTVVGAATSLGAAGGTAAGLAARRGVIPPLVAVLAIGIGLWRAGSVYGDVPPRWPPSSERMRVQATVDAPAETRGTVATFSARIDRVLEPIGAETPTGRIRVTVPALPPLQAGQPVEIVGRIEPVDRASAAGARIAREGVTAMASFPGIVALGPPEESQLPATLRRLRSAIEATIQRTLPEPHAALLTGLLVGSTAGMPESLRLALVGSGTSHLVVVSGYNISLVAAALVSVFRTGRVARIVVPLAGVWAFTLVAGANAPAVRAALMATMALVALRAGRGADALGALALAAAGMLLIDPHLMFDLGFQLSMLATLGLVALQPRVAGLFGWLPSQFREPASSTLAAQLATMPLLAATFHQISIVAPVSNLLAAPAIPLATIVGAIGVGLAAAVPPLTGLVSIILTLPISYLIAVFEWTAALPSAVAPVGEVHPAVSVVYGAGLLVWAVAPTPEGKDLIHALRSIPLARPVAAGAAVLCAAGIVALAGPGSAPQPLVVSVLDVGHGDAVLARTPSGRTVLIDGGPNPSALLAQIGRRMGMVERNLSTAILTRADAERLPGMTAAAERYSPDLMIGPPEGSPAGLYQRWQALSSGVRALTPETGMSIHLEPDLSIELTPTGPLPALTEAGSPQRTLVVRIVYGETSILLGPSLTRESGRALMREGWPLRSDALLVPRHGATAGLDPALVASIQPRLAVISVGARNRQELPTRETLAALSDATVYRTDLNGTVELRSDGKTLWAVPERTVN